MSGNNTSLKEVVLIRQALAEYRDREYLNLIRRLKEKTDVILVDDLGTQFVHNCGRDLAGEVVRNFFDTSDYCITVDQMAMRILNFKYEDEYDPLGDNTEIQKSVYNYNDVASSTLDKITSDLDSSQKKLFEKESVWNESKQKNEQKYKDRALMEKGKKDYVESVRNADGSITDEYTGKEGEYSTDKNGNKTRRQEVDHVQSAAAATYNSKLITEKGKEALKEFYNSADNFAMMDKVANASKGDVRVYDKNGNDITHRASPEQLADAVCERWENVSKNDTKKELTDKGYLNEDGKVPKSVKRELVKNIRYSQNTESKVILNNTDYKAVAKDAGGHVKAGLGKIIAGQIIYYSVPPIVYEMKRIVKEKSTSLEKAIDDLTGAGKRIGNYVFGHLRDVFKNITENSLKKFIKSFMDILIGMVKATVKKLLKVVKSMVLSVVDSVKIITTPGMSGAQKADSVFNLFGVTITNVVIELIFEAIENGAHIPEMLLKPLQIITSVVCTNLTILILQKADLFDVRRGFKLGQIRKVFAEERERYALEMETAEDYADYKVNYLIEKAKAESVEIYNNLMSIDVGKQSVRGDLERINSLFDIDIDFDAEWLKFLGINLQPA